MSNEKVKTSLKGYVGPFFPGVLHATYASSKEIRRDKLRQIGARVTGFLDIEDVITDGYNPWYCQLIFEVGERGRGRVAVLLPYSHPRYFGDGTTTQCHTALYVQGGVSTEYMFSIAAQLVKAFKIVCPQLAVQLL